ncbi:hypothetical protein MASR2M54_12570 [Aliarcobacter cryaerophilus]
MFGVYLILKTGIKFMDNLNCQICENSVKRINFKIEKCVTSDTRVINTPLGHSYCLNCGFVLLDLIKELIMKNFIKMNMNFY